MKTQYVTQAELELFKLQFEAERQDLQLEINVLRRSLAQLRMKLLGEEQPKMRRIS